MYSIYIISDRASTKRYVGMTKIHVQKRFAQHLFFSKKINVPLYRAMKKRSDDFSIHHVASCSSKNEACCVERMLIKELSTLLPHGYNATKGGDGTQEWSVEMKVAARSRAVRQFSSESARYLASEKSREAWGRPGFRKKMSQAAVERSCNPETALKNNAVLALAREKLRDPSVQEKRLAALRATNSSDAIRKIRSEAGKKRYLDPKNRELTALQTKAGFTVDVRHKISISVREAIAAHGPEIAHKKRMTRIRNRFSALPIEMWG